MIINESGLFFRYNNQNVGKFCKKCMKLMKNINATHCSDECLLSNVKNSKSLDKYSKGAESWNEEADPWK